MTDSPTPPPTDQTARRGILKQLQRAGGSMHIKDLHEFSTLRFGRGHREFSETMEGLVADDLVLYDGTLFHLTDKGRETTKGMLL